jgi:hypothetical protein
MRGCWKKLLLSRCSHARMRREGHVKFDQLGYMIEPMGGQDLLLSPENFVVSKPSIIRVCDCLRRSYQGAGFLTPLYLLAKPESPAAIVQLQP